MPTEEKRTLGYNIFDIMPGAPLVSNYFNQSLNPTLKNTFSGGVSPNNFIDGAVYGILQSGNFIEGSDGWRIQPNGDVEFNDGTFRGSISASSIDIPDANTVSSFHVDSSGNVWWGATTQAASIASVTKDGIASFVGLTVINMKAYTDFEAAARFTNATGGTGAVTLPFSTSGVKTAATVAGIGFARVLWGIGTANDLPNENLKFSASIANASTLGNTSSHYVGVGRIAVASTGHTFTDAHVGFKVLVTTTARTLYATQAVGGTETVSAALITLATSDLVDLFIVIHATSVDYYYRKIPFGGSPAAFTKLTINTTPPTTFTGAQCQVSSSNDNNSLACELVCTSMGLER